MSETELRHQISALTSALEGRALDQALQDWLNREHGSGSDTYRQLEQSCRKGVEEGWLCQHQAGGIRYGRCNRCRGLFRTGACQE